MVNVVISFLILAMGICCLVLPMETLIKIRFAKPGTKPMQAKIIGGICTLLGLFWLIMDLGLLG